VGEEHCKKGERIEHKAENLGRRGDVGPSKEMRRGGSNLTSLRGRGKGRKERCKLVFQAGFCDYGGGCGGMTAYQEQR